MHRITIDRVRRLRFEKKFALAQALLDVYYSEKELVRKKALKQFNKQISKELQRKKICVMCHKTHDSGKKCCQECITQKMEEYYARKSKSKKRV